MMTKAKQLRIRFAAAVSMLLLASITLAQDDTGAGDFDIAMGIPQAMWVGTVDEENGLVELDGQLYRITQAKPMGLIEDPGPRLNLSDLKPGMQVMVATDGTMAAPGHAPMVFGLWQVE